MNAPDHSIGRDGTSTAMIDQRDGAVEHLPGGQVDDVDRCLACLSTWRRSRWPPSRRPRRSRAPCSARCRPDAAGRARAADPARGRRGGHPLQTGDALAQEDPAEDQRPERHGVDERRHPARGPCLERPHEQADHAGGLQQTPGASCAAAGVGRSGRRRAANSRKRAMAPSPVRSAVKGHEVGVLQTDLHDHPVVAEEDRLAGQRGDRQPAHPAVGTGRTAWTRRLGGGAARGTVGARHEPLPDGAGRPPRGRMRDSTQPTRPAGRDHDGEDAHDLSVVQALRQV